MPRSARSGLWPFVGRDDELDRFRRALADPDRTGFLVTGPAGVGKSRLADECLAQAAAAGVPVARAVTGRTGAGIPLGALAHLLPLSGGSPEPAGPIAVSAADEAAALLDRTRAVWRDRAGGRRQVLLVDDLDLLDPVSLDLLTRLAADGVVFLLSTLRTAGDAATPVDVPGGTVRADLGELDVAGVDRLLNRALGGPVTAATAAALWRASQGNVLFLRELVIGSVAAGTLVRTDDVWRLTSEPGTTARLDQLIESRLAALGARDRQVLEHLAVCQPLEAGALAGVAPPERVEELERLGLVRIETRGRRRTAHLAHPLYTQVVRRRTPSLRAERILREQIARIRAHGARRQDDALRLAEWELEVSGTGDPALLLRAAQHSCHVHDFATAERLAAAALAAPGGAGLAAVALFLIGHAQAQLDRPEEGAAALAAAAEAVELPRQAALLREITAERATTLAFTLSRMDEALALVEDALGPAPTEEPGEEHAELLAVAALILTVQGNPGRAATLLDAVPADRSSAATAIARLETLSAVGRPLAALAAIDALVGGRSARELAGAATLLPHPSSLRFSMAAAATAAGLLDRGAEEAEAGLRAAVHDDLPGPHASGALHLARVHLIAGRARTAMRWFREAAGVARASHQSEPMRVALAGLTILHTRLGDAGAARAQLDELTAQWPGPPQVLVVLAEVWVLAAEGQTTRAVEILQKSAAADAAAGHVCQEVVMRHNVARLGFPELVADRMTVLAAASDNPLLAARARYAAGLAHRDATVLTAAGEEFARIGALLFAAEAFRGAGQALRAAGQSQQAVRAGARAAALLDRCEGGQSPASLGLDGPVLLSRREREVALLAAGGHASKEIADRLGLSARTVSNHLQNAYTKLGVSGRAELARTLGTVDGAPVVPRPRAPVTGRRRVGDLA